MKDKKPFSVSISTGCVIYILVVIFIFWLGIRLINRCTEPEYHIQPVEQIQKDTIFIHDTIYVDKLNTKWEDTLKFSDMKRNR